ncbi:MAG: PKD domain-containing protein, partial [Bacteroidetes bacterium]|nr:PKD domain-containing protein [Bacteroidota bacterium]
TVLEETIQLGSLSTLQTKGNQTPLSFKLSASLPALEMLSFRLEFSTPEGYKDYQYFNFRTSGEYIDFKVDDLTLTIASNGNLGYNYDYNLQGLGLRYQNAALAHNMGLAIAQNPTAVANNVVNTMLPTRRDLDFRTMERLRLYNHSLATMDARSSFEVIVRDSSQLNLRIDQKILGWSNPGDAAAVVLEYKIINRADTAYENLHVALFSDFNLMDAYQNRAQWDASHHLGYTYNENTGRYAGIALLTDQTQLHHALNLKTREGNTADVGNIMSRRHKWEFMNKGIANTAAGINGKGNDVAKFLGGTIPSLAPLTTEKVVFALVTAPSLEALQAATVEAQQNYINYANANPNLLAVVTICPGISQTLTPKSGSRYRFYSTKNDVTPVAEGETIDLPPFYRDTTIYVLNIDKEWGGTLERIEIDVEELSASFTPSTEDLLLNAGLDETIYFTDASQNAVSWSWNFGNGQSSTSRNPEVVYTETGTYLVELQVSNLAGCTLTTSHTIRVHRKEELPVMATASTICPNSTITLQEVNQRLINLYADENRSTLLFSGDRYVSDPLPATTDFYISSGVGIVESDVVKVTVPVFESQLEIVYSQMLSEQYTYALKLVATIEASATASLVNWYQNGTHIGSGQSITLGYQARNEAPDITMLVLFENGCEIAYNQKLPLSAAALPELQNLEVCKGEAPLVKPVADGLYYFYADAALTELLYRGTSYQMPALDASQTLFITNLSGGLESEALSLNIHIAEALAAFSLTADTLTIKNGVANLTLNSTSPDATRWTWNFGDGSTSTEQNPTHGYTQAGTYTISLQAESALGCTEILSKEVVILPTQEKILGYPNPTSGPLTLQLPTNLPAGGELLVMDAAGHKLIQQSLGTGTNLQLDLQDLPKGIYLIRVMHGQQSWHSRVVRQ